MSVITTFFDNNKWTPADGINRSFVRYQDPGESPGVYRIIQHGGEEIRVTVIIPTCDADRGGYFQQLLDQVEQQNYQNFELIVVKGDHLQGRAINIGAALAKGKYLMTVDDDSSLPDMRTLEKLVAAMDAHPDIGMAGGNNTVPDWASPFVKQVMRQVPRRSWEPVSEIVDSDLAEHPCLIMRAELFRQVGGENEQMPRGLDPYLRKQFRDAGSRVVILPGVIYHHLPPDTWRKLLAQFYRNGRQAAYANVHSPEWVIETPAEHGEFVERVPLWRRVLRFPLRMLGGLLDGKWVWVVCEACYAWGFLVGWIQEKGKH